MDLLTGLVTVATVVSGIVWFMVMFVHTPKTEPLISTRLSWENPLDWKGTALLFILLFGFVTVILDMTLV